MGILKLIKSVFKKPDKQLDNTIDKIDFILSNPINLYNNLFLYKKTIFVTNNIYNFIEELEEFNKANIEKDILYVKNISSATNVEIDYITWLSKDNNIQNDMVDTLIKFLHLSKEFYIRYSIGIKLLTNSKYNTNCRRLQPYIINIDNILNDIISIV